MPRQANATPPTILFGAFDRHNFGDLLLAHVAAQLLPTRELQFAGLVARDLRRFGGHRVRAIAELIASHRGERLDLIHVGGELLTCDAWEAAVMVSARGSVQTAIAQQAAWRRDPAAWAHATFGTRSLAPYVVAKAAWPDLQGGRVYFNAVGGVHLHKRDPAFRSEIAAALAAATAVSVRDECTRAHLQAMGIATRLIPDPAVMVNALFGARIRARASLPAMADVLTAFAQGYAAVQFDARFSDDATLDIIAGQLDQVAAEQGLGIVLFRAGAAPWHDDIDVYRRLAQRLRVASLRIFGSLQVWDICALIAHGRVYCGSSLHGRIVAMAFALARVNLAWDGDEGTEDKPSAFAATWDRSCLPASTLVGGMAAAIECALAVDQTVLQQTAGDLVARYREGFATFARSLDGVSS